MRKRDIYVNSAVNENQVRRFYFPGRSQGQPYKANPGRICYSITKSVSEGTATIQGDRLDHFLSKADQRINYYESLFRKENPYNPYNKVVEFNIGIVDDHALMQIRDKMKREVGVKVDELLVVEGCESDDKIVLGGKEAFVSHFCSYFNFNMCYANEKRGVKALSKFMNDGDRINSSLENFVNNIDKRL